MTRRSASARFVPGAYVFPGGVIDAADTQSHPWASRRATQGNAHLTVALAALRETFEEVGVLLARRADGMQADGSDVAAMDRQAPLAEQCAARGLTLDAAQVHMLARWITDRELPQRFDVPYLVARMPEGQQAVADGREQFDPQWLRPADALARHAADQLFIIYPTIRTLERLQAFDSVHAVLETCARDEEPLWTSCPRAGQLNGTTSRHMEHEAPFGELALVCPNGHSAHALEWRSDRPVALLKNVQRLTAPNPGTMTGPGTNSYLVGEAATGYAVIDPGPHHVEHIDRLWRAAGGDVRAIVCTHSHPDHAPGAPALQAWCVDQGCAAPPILGLPSATTSRENSRFTPERALADGERLTLRSPAGEVLHSLRVVHTPGHAANHLCLLLEEDGLLFSGDHILNGSTTVVDPPDGHMGDYLASLDKLNAACAEHSVHFILPAHGYVMGDWALSEQHPTAPEHGGARAAIAHLKQHRLAREAKVAQAMRQVPGGNLDDWLPLAYNDVPTNLWPVAKRSLLAHVQHIQSKEPL